ncbi:hypothetical protein FJ934_05730 [Mesorhizobium sp. B2-4-12]|uniref:hypothetical protein n=1 Tax=unclassified Mesorhizobium TaxID=325217 RepID=UPI00112D2FB6|nr:MULTISPECIES: hypothetical protein [unclassified Mesorhizobium]TPK91112.1 hypothetical protein FJ548_05255 [Mesorhizobium sp. B2-4-17]TPK97739.1 hypothetical protein FJ934_05730 [Mesorhizobium sp. B2-4-12]TPL10928.1 hypothetical protein FJ938_04385 [Mesorhizobium sp. B2-4-14]UCI31602.1 hypothetical protein FJW03_28215 [Mesorhizobium sp. B4-1-4]
MAFFIETNPFNHPDSCYWEPPQRRASRLDAQKNAVALLILHMILSENRFPIFGIMRGSGPAEVSATARWEGMGRRRASE